MQADPAQEVPAEEMADTSISAPQITVNHLSTPERL